MANVRCRLPQRNVKSLKARLQKKGTCPNCIKLFTQSALQNKQVRASNSKNNGIYSKVLSGSWASILLLLSFVLFMFPGLLRSEEI